MVGPQRVRVAELFETSVSPAANLWLRWRHAPPSRRESTALVFADPQLPTLSGEPADERGWMIAQGSQLGRLPSSELEGRRIAHALDGVLWRGGEATESRLMQDRLQRHAILHFATHALVDDTEPRRSAVLLSPGENDQDGLLQAREIVALALDGRVVILSACRPVAVVQAWSSKGEVAQPRAIVLRWRGAPRHRRSAASARRLHHAHGGKVAARLASGSTHGAALAGA